MDLVALKAELTAGHPDTGAYDADDALAAGELNAVNRTRSRDTITGSEILNATDDTEFSALTDANKDRWISICGVENINTSSGIAKALEADLFGGGTTTRANLVAVKTEDISRAVELGFSFVGTHHVTSARAI